MSTAVGKRPELVVSEDAILLAAEFRKEPKLHDAPCLIPCSSWVVVACTCERCTALSDWIQSPGG